MAINLEKHKPALLDAWKDVLDEKTETNWALFGYDGLTNDLKHVSNGDGGLTELIDEFNSGKIQYAFLKVDMPNGSISKYVLINWQGEGAPTVRKGTCANHIKHVSQLFTGFHVTMHARTEDDLDEKIILDKLSKAGSAYNFKSRTEELPPSGPVGTTYKKVNPVQEINSKERDQFWLKEELEEKKRVEAERRRREEEKKKGEEEVRRRDELEAAKRAKAEPQQAPPSGAEGVRRQRSQEARALIGASTAAARAVFQGHLAQGQITHRSNSIPEKPVRSSVIAQRINTFSQNTSQSQSLTSPPLATPPKIEKDTLEQPQEQPKTSPLKNIDKIKMSLESPSQIQYEPIIDPTDLSPSTDTEPAFGSINYSDPSTNNEPAFSSVNYSDPSTGSEPAFSSINYSEYKQSEPMIKQNILENDIEAYASSNENDDDDSDNKFSTIKRSPYTKNERELSRQNTVIENVNYKENGTTTLEDISPEGLEEESTIYEDLDDDPGLSARALYDYQAADESEITFDPGDVITHIEQVDAGWWQGLGPGGSFGLFPANYVELLPPPR